MQKHTKPTKHTKNTKIDLDTYFSDYISWDYDSQKKAALKKFFSLCRNL